MKRTARFLSILVCLLMLACAVNTAAAEAVTLNIVLSGAVTAQDGTVNTVRLSGQPDIYKPMPGEAR